MARNQLNIRVSDQLERLIDQKRIALTESMGSIPSRSDVVRFALESYLGVDLSESEADGRTSEVRDSKAVTRAAAKPRK